jgi:hypothetical protein
VSDPVASLEERPGEWLVQPPMISDKAITTTALFPTACMNNLLEIIYIKRVQTIISNALSHAEAWSGEGIRQDGPRFVSLCVLSEQTGPENFGSCVCLEFICVT